MLQVTWLVVALDAIPLFGSPTPFVADWPLICDNTGSAVDAFGLSFHSGRWEICLHASLFSL